MIDGLPRFGRRDHPGHAAWEAVDHIARAVAAMEACKTPVARTGPEAPAAAAESAGGAPPKPTAKEHFARATSFHKQGDYTSALRELTSAYDAEPTPLLMYAIAQTHGKLGQCSEATTFYRRFIDSKPKQDAVARAHGAIAACKDSMQPGATAPATASKPVAPSAADGLKKAELRNTPVEIVRKEPPINREPVDLKPAAVTPVAPIQAERPVEMVRVDREDRYDRHPTRKWAYVGAGVGAGAMLVGTIFGAAADATQKSFDDAGCGEREQVLGADATAECLALERRGARNVRIGNGFLIGGGGALALFAVLLIIDPGNIERPRLDHPRLGGATVSVSTRSVQLSIPW